MNNRDGTGVIPFLMRHKFALLLCAVGIALLSVGGKKNDTNGTDAAQSEPSELESARIYTEYLEEKIEDLLSEVDGISKVTVLLTLDGSHELVYAENSSEGAMDYVIIESGDGEEPVLVREIYASVRGIAVVCRGGERPELALAVTELLASAFDLPKTKISVAGAD